MPRRIALCLPPRFRAHSQLATHSPNLDRKSRVTRLWPGLATTLAWLTLAMACFFGTALFAPDRAPEAALSKRRTLTPVSHQAAATKRIVGIDYGPFRDGQSPLTGSFPTTAQMQADMPILRRMGDSIRTYSALNGFDQIPALAKQSDLKVVPTAWLGKNTTANNAEIAQNIRHDFLPYALAFEVVEHSNVLYAEHQQTHLLAFQMVKLAYLQGYDETAAMLNLWDARGNCKSSWSKPEMNRGRHVRP